MREVSLPAKGILSVKDKAGVHQVDRMQETMEGFKCKEKNWASSPDALGGQWGALNEGSVDTFEFSVTHQAAVWRGRCVQGMRPEAERFILRWKEMSLNRSDKRATQGLIQSSEHGYEEWIVFRLKLQAQNMKVPPYRW